MVARTSRPTVVAMQRHVSTVARTNSIKYRTIPGIEGWALVPDRKIGIPVIKSVRTYARALHELGHILGGSARRMIEIEALAWAWARHNALIWTPTMDLVASACLRTYFDDATLSRPAQGHVAYAVLHAQYPMDPNAQITRLR